MHVILNVWSRSLKPLLILSLGGFVPIQQPITCSLTGGRMRPPHRHRGLIIWNVLVHKQIPQTGFILHLVNSTWLM